MDDRGRPFMTPGMFRTIPSSEAACKITCPRCSFTCYSHHIPGTCLSITCMECGSKYMGVTDKVKCGECNDRLKCIGMQPVIFEMVSKQDIPRNKKYNLIVPTDMLEVAQAALKSGIVGITVTKNFKK